MIEEVKMFKTDDGMVFETEVSAKEHEAEISFVGWYDNSNRLYSDTEVVHGKEIVEWLINNKKQILDFLQKIS